MSDPYRILIPYFTRSEWGPLTPLLDVIKKDERLEAVTVAKKMDSLQAISDVLAVLAPDMVLCGFDRPEMVPVAYGAYHKHIPIAQIFAGDIAGGAFDDADRFTISNYADLLFCSDFPQFERMKKALNWKYEIAESHEIYISGSTHFDDMRFEESDWPAPYVLVLYNPPSLSYEIIMPLEEIIEEELAEIERVCQGQKVLWAQPNGDKGSDIVRRFAEKMRNTDLLPEMSRWNFLGIMQRASLFVGNSSAMFYEAPYLNVPIKQIGIRNRRREPISKEMCVPGASKYICDYIVKHLDWRKQDGT